MQNNLVIIQNYCELKQLSSQKIPAYYMDIARLVRIVSFLDKSF